MNRKLWLLLVSAFVLVVAAAAVHRWRRASSTVYFLGDSITQQWWYPRKNAGVFGQTSDQILKRFPTALREQNVHTICILAGTNDVLLKHDPDAAVANIERMVNLAREQQVLPIVATIPPIYREDGAYLPAVQVLNEKIRSFAARDHVCLVDYYGVLLNHPNYESDGVHMKKLGYLSMEYELLRDSRHCE